MFVVLIGMSRIASSKYVNSVHALVFYPMFMFSVYTPYTPLGEITIDSLRY